MPAENHYEMGLAYQREGAYAAAVTEFELAVRENPDHGLAHQELALSLYEIGDPTSAETSAKRALELSPSLSMARVGLALILSSTGRDEEAEREYHVLLRERRSLMPARLEGEDCSKNACQKHAAGAAADEEGLMPTIFSVR